MPLITYSDTCEHQENNIEKYECKNNRDYYEDHFFYDDEFIHVNESVFVKKSLKHSESEYTIYHQSNRKDGMENMDGKRYLQKIMNDHKWNAVEMNPEILSGMPIVKRTRIQISLLIACLRDEMSIEEICEDYSLDSQMIKESLEFVIKVLDGPFEEEYDE